jgi:aryl-alcohol dehydrogenase-like predicted oxidoreductase
LVSNQPQYSMLWRVIEEWVVPVSAELGISQICWSPVAQGVLTGKYLPGQPPPPGTRATDAKGGANMIKRMMDEQLLTVVQGLAPIASDLDLTMSQLAIAWVLQNPNVAAAIIGASKPKQIVENVAAAGVVLPEDVMQRIDLVLGDLPVRNPMLTAQNSPKERPC